MSENEKSFAESYYWLDDEIAKRWWDDDIRDYNYKFKKYPLDFECLTFCLYVKNSGLVKNYDYDIYALYGCRSDMDVTNYYESTKTKNAWNKYLNKEKSRIIWFSGKEREPLKILFGKGC